MTERFLRSEMLLGPAAMERLAVSHVCVVGLGGVGSWAAEVLARSGVGELTLVDEDCSGESNINRQLGALSSTIGQPKAEILARRALDIHPVCKVHPVQVRYSRDTSDSFFRKFDYLVDAIDLVACKTDLICRTLAHGIPIISALGTGNKLDPSKLEVTDLSKTHGCPLARVMRRELGRRGIQHLKVVYSPEEAVQCAALETPPPGRRSVPGSVPWVPPAAGILLGGAVVMDLIAEQLKDYQTERT